MAHKVNTLSYRVSFSSRSEFAFEWSSALNRKHSGCYRGEKKVHCLISKAASQQKSDIDFQDENTLNSHSYVQ